MSKLKINYALCRDVSKGGGGGGGGGGALGPQIVLYTCITFTPQKFCAFIFGGMPRPEKVCKTALTY